MRAPLEHRMPDRAILVAGGRGTRLGAIGRDVPKPLLPVQGVPVIERLIARLRESGVQRCTVVTCHRAAEVEARLGDGGRLGVALDYLRESLPLGTGGCLGLIPRPDRPFYLANADILTDMCFRALADRHLRAGGLATVAVRRHATPIDFGVAEFDPTGRLTGYHEKPVHESFIGMGIYCLEPTVCDHVTPGEPTSMPEILSRMLVAGERVSCHPVAGLWLDIGRPEDYAASQSLPLDDAGRPGRSRAA